MQAGHQRTDGCELGVNYSCDSILARRRVAASAGENTERKENLRSWSFLPSPPRRRSAGPLMATKSVCEGAGSLFALEYPTNRFRDFALRWQPPSVAFRSLIMAPASQVSEGERRAEPTQKKVVRPARRGEAFSGGRRRCHEPQYGVVVQLQLHEASQRCALLPPRGEPPGESEVGDPAELEPD